MENHLLQNYRSAPVTIVRGEGCYLFDDAWTRYEALRGRFHLGIFIWSAERALKQRLIGFRPPERLSFAIDGGDAAERDEHRRGPTCRAGLLGDLFAELVVFLRRGAHERDAGVVLIESAAAKLIGHRVGRAELRP